MTTHRRRSPAGSSRKRSIRKYTIRWCSMCWRDR